MTQPTTSRRSTVCLVCGRVLTDEESVSRGYGPECAKRFADRTAFETRLPVGCRVRLVPGNSCEGLAGEVIGHRHRKGKPAQVVIRIDGKTWLHTALEAWVERIEEGQVAA